MKADVIRPPYDREAEESLLGSIMLDATTLDDVMLEVQGGDFFESVHSEIFEACAHLYQKGRPLDPLLVHKRLEKSGVTGYGGMAALGKMLTKVPNAAHAKHYATIVRNASILRQVIQLANDCLKEAHSGQDADDVLEAVEGRMGAITDRAINAEPDDARALLLGAMNEIAERHEHGNRSSVRTGFEGFDSLLGGGLHKGQLIIIAGRPSMGKTAVALNIASYAAKKEVPTLMVSLEMGKLELAERLLSSHSRVNCHRMRQGTLSQDDRSRLVASAGEMSQYTLFVLDNPLVTVRQIAAHARRLRRKKGLGLVVVDYLTLVNPSNHKVPRQEQVAAISRELKALAKQLEVPVLVLAQLNRQAEAAKDNRPKLSHLRESGALEQDADVVAFVHREEYYRHGEEQRDFAGQAELILAKQRSGPTGTVALIWRKEYTKFEEPAPERYTAFDDHNNERTPYRDYPDAEPFV